MIENSAGQNGLKFCTELSIYSGSGLCRVKICVAPRKSLQGAKTFFGLGQKSLESESGPDLGTCNRYETEILHRSTEPCID